MKKIKPNHSVFIRSRGRAGTLTTPDVFPWASLVVHKSEGKKYRQAGYKGDMVEIPLSPEDEVDWNTSLAWNWIIDQSPTDRILLLDDDISRIGYVERRKLHVAEGAQILRFCNNMFDMAEDLGTSLWGINQQYDPKFYREYTPFSLTSVTLGPVFGLIRTELRADIRIFTKEDYDFALQVLHRDRVILRSNKWHYIAEHLTNPGGANDYRTMDLEESHNKRLIRKWGEKVVRRSRQGRKSVNCIIKWPIPGI